ncbi:hypothetical protein KFE25_001348 [Diacronema lutheri]|uniref:Uncharacterized protein n=1 Tax=Diacronema lutheri TaxID=2081491 RepID=A0A8J5XF35_DIALT|nr:hypothetical protein KFE25_001348 [Diacronema lutheri]|mmetsp:Transcript_2909/g.9062  ORF Transcript_2909/g.9062 Transcript_2909/m.9062 type:complete len:217 (-) Transcript_2909:430-1080(-)
MQALAAASRRSPLVVGSLTAFGVVSAGDVAVQLLREPSVDLSRSMVPATYSGALAPAYIVWWKWLDVRFPGAGLGPAMRKAMVNQLVTSLPSNVGYMAWCTLWLGGATSRERAGERLAERMRTELPSIIVAAFSFWMPMNALNFACVPIPSRVLFMSLANCAWAGWLSNAVNSPTTRATIAPAAAAGPQVLGVGALESVAEAAAGRADAALGGCAA